MLRENSGILDNEKPLRDVITENRDQDIPENPTADGHKTEEWGIVDRLLTASRHRGQKVYKVKWRDQAKTKWEPDEIYYPSLLMNSISKGHKMDEENEGDFPFLTK